MERPGNASAPRAFCLTPSSGARVFGQASESSDKARPWNRTGPSVPPPFLQRRRFLDRRGFQTLP